jgi:hypothetical protein
LVQAVQEGKRSTTEGSGPYLDENPVSEGKIVHKGIGTLIVGPFLDLNVADPAAVIIFAVGTLDLVGGRVALDHDL